LAVDDTLCRKRGLTVYGTGMHHDPLISSRAKPLVSWGHDWVVVTLLVVNPFWASTKVWSLPIAFRLYRNRQGLTKGQKKAKGSRQGPKAKKSPKRPPDPNHRTRPELAVELLTMVAGWFPDRPLLVSGDSAYGGASVLQKLPANVDLISHVHPKGTLYEPAPAPSGKGRPAKKGRRLPGMKEWANDPAWPWQTLVFDQFGLHATLQVKTRQALYYKAGKDRLLTIVLVRDVLGRRPDQMFYGTRRDWTARQILATYAGRWSIEMHQSYYLLWHSSYYGSGRGLGRANSGICGWFHQVRGQLCRRRKRSNSSASAQMIQEPCTPGSWRACTSPLRTQRYKVGLGICRWRLKSESHHSSAARGHVSWDRARGPVRIWWESKCCTIPALNVTQRLGG